MSGVDLFREAKPALPKGKCQQDLFSLGGGMLCPSAAPWGSQSPSLLLLSGEGWSLGSGLILNNEGSVVNIKFFFSGRIMP